MHQQPKWKDFWISDWLTFRKKIFALQITKYKDEDDEESYGEYMPKISREKSQTLTILANQMLIILDDNLFVSLINWSLLSLKIIHAKNVWKQNREFQAHTNKKKKKNLFFLYCKDDLRILLLRWFFKMKQNWKPISVLNLLQQNSCQNP